MDILKKHWYYSCSYCCFLACFFFTKLWSKLLHCI